MALIRVLNVILDTKLDTTSPTLLDYRDRLPKLKRALLSAKLLALANFLMEIE